jgi:hypothetical protein
MYNRRKNHEGTKGKLLLSDSYTHEELAWQSCVQQMCIFTKDSDTVIYNSDLQCRHRRRVSHL